MHALVPLIAWLCLNAGPQPPALIPQDPFEAATEVITYSFEEAEDQDADRLPDDWIRRRGTDFPAYVKAHLDESVGHAGRNSLRVRVNGGRLTYYSPINAAARVDPEFNYVFRGFIKTSGLRNDAAQYSVSFLNHRKERLQRFLTKPVSGTHAGWVKLELGPLMPDPDARFVVIGCHLVTGEEADLSGNVWFDDVMFGRLPRLTLTGDIRHRYVAPGHPIRLAVEVSGVEVGVPFELLTSLSDIHGQVVWQQTEPVQLKTDTGAANPSGTRFPFEWTISPQASGCYFVRTMLNRGGKLVLLGETAIAVMEPANTKPQGEFGWSLTDGYGEMRPRDLAFVASEGGVHWLKLPLWKGAYGEGSIGSRHRELFEQLADRSISVVGVLSDPPQAVTKRYGNTTVLGSDLFQQPTSFWASSLEPVVTEFSGSVDHWQLGADDDVGFFAAERLNDIVQRGREVLERGGRSPKIGLPWRWPNESPLPNDLGRAFLSSRMPADITDEQLARYLRGAKSLSTERWVSLDLPSTDSSVEARAIQLAQRLIAARTLEAPVVFATDALRGERGLIRKDGGPGELFLPWRTTALALQGAKPIGSLRLPEKATNFAFERNNEVVLVLWSATPVTERLNLGDKAERQELWGQRQKLPRTEGSQTIAVTESPIFCLGCSVPLTKWYLAVGFENSRIPSTRGAHPNAIVGRNTFGRSALIDAKLKLPRGWIATPDQWSLTVPAGEAFRLPTAIQLPEDASLGTIDATLEFQVVGDKPERIEIVRPLEVGLGDVVVDVKHRKLPDGRLEIEQILINNTNPEETLEFRCNLSVSGQKRQTRYVSDLTKGEDRKLYYLPNADSLRGQALWLNLEQVGGKRNLNKRLIIGRDW